ncbi:serine hydrolase domain-containing protein [Sediminivirga luteola]|uniref:Beta-lactamase-related domain-containing protein n=1 Tax=Sediminivirga luteola TaxID=1774748 RepID=A0A8J2TYD0_9MICO|nr:serine hydrolase domain-containing protein [Sediminivirga luteola]GGA14872.1 hypothetical protein GCM10011333_17340 [Sediminivirga luteola]
MDRPPLVVPAGDNTARPDAQARLQRVLQKLIARRGGQRLHHATVAVASADGSLRWSAAAGAADEAGPPDPGRPFFIASVTKRFIVTLLLQAHERGEVDLAAPITGVLPPDVTTGLHTLRGTDHTPAVTVRHLATHTSGLPDHFERRSDGPSLYSRLAAGQDTSWSFEDMIRTTREQQRGHFAPQDLSASRQKARYSDTGFQLLIRILETVTGQDFAGLLAERITGPAGLHHTWHPGHSPAPRHGAAPGHGAAGPHLTGDDPAPPPTTICAGRHPVNLGSLIASSNDLISTTGDLLRFQRALRRGDLFRSTRTAALLTERRNRLRNIPVLRYGMGTMIFRTVIPVAGRLRAVTLVGHSGATGSWLFSCPELGVDLAGTVDQAGGRNAQSLPFRVMARCLAAWSG